MWWKQLEPDWRDAFGELSRMRQDMDRLFHNLDPSASQGSSGVFPPLNVSRDDEAFYVRAELPGIQADRLDITATNNSLTLSGQREIPEEESGVSYHRREREGGSFKRSITLPDGFDAEKVQARYLDGVLTVRLPLTPAQRPRQISVQAS